MSRTIVTAARTGRLKQLTVNEVHSPFAVREMIPIWVGVDMGSDYSSDWLGAACHFRPLLSHASLWLGTTLNSGARPDRLLTALEIQALRSVFAREGVPQVTGSTWHSGWSGDPPITKYLSWLEQDAKLAQKVADAWNAALERGDADLVKYRCKRCKAPVTH